MNLFENTLSRGFQDYSHSKELLDFVEKRSKEYVDEIMSGKNKDVEKRFKYYVEHG